jgi:hypothetical protein
MKSLVFFFAMTAGISASAQQTDKQQITRAFEQYKAAALNSNGRDAVQYLDKKTIDYYSHLLEEIRTADSVRLESSSVLDKYVVLLIRHSVDPKEIVNLDGRSFLSYAIERGFVGKSELVHNSITDITVSGNFASARMVSKEDGSAAPMEFYKEKDGWKVNFSALIRLSIPAFRNLIRESGQDENTIILSMVEMSTGRRPDPTVWIPLAKR